MAATATKVRMMLQEFLALPEDDLKHFELEYGELIEVGRPTFEHNEWVIELAHAIMAHVRHNGLARVSGDTLVIFDPSEDLSYAPDIVFVATEHLDRIREGRVWGAPDLVVEFLSPTTASRDYGIKMDAYFRYGVPWYWIVHPDDLTLVEYRYTPDGYLRTQTVLAGQVFRPGCFPGLEIDLQRLAEAQSP